MPVLNLFIMNRRLSALVAALALSAPFWDPAAFAETQSGAGAPELSAATETVETASVGATTARAPARIGKGAPRLGKPGSQYACPAGDRSWGVSRTVVLDAEAGRHYGAGRDGYLSTSRFLGPKEIVLTFDDGPSPRATREILATLRDYCVKATFFVVGETALRRPELLAEIAADGHTIAGHTSSHPMPFARRSLAAATQEIEQGYQEVEEALGRPISRMFRFPGLSDSAELLDYLSNRGLMSLSIDVDSGDTKSGATTAKVISWTIARVERRGGGVILFHDPLKRTARALPTILSALQSRGYRIVHLQTTTPYAPPGGAEPAAARREVWPRPTYRAITKPPIAAVY